MFIQKIVLLLVFLMNGFLMMAQKRTEPVKLSHYVFETFRPGKVKVKSGVVSDQVLNYNILTGEMIYESQGKPLAISNPADVDTVTIEGRIFVPADNKFYELLSSGKAALFLETTCTVSEEGTPLGYGMASNTTASASFRELLQSGGAYSLKLPDNFKVVPKYNFLVFYDGRYQKANNLQQLSRIFPAKKKQLKDFAAKNNTHFENRSDLIAIVSEAVRE